jgi:hypothetical protein
LLAAAGIASSPDGQAWEAAPAGEAGGAGPTKQTLHAGWLVLRELRDLLLLGFVAYVAWRFRIVGLWCLFFMGLLLQAKFWHDMLPNAPAKEEEEQQEQEPQGRHKDGRDSSSDDDLLTLLGAESTRYPGSRPGPYGDDGSDSGPDGGADGADINDTGASFFTGEDINDAGASFFDGADINDAGADFFF